MKNFFELIHTDKKTGARAGVIHTAHGDIETPCFMPVGTQATVKTLDSDDLRKLDAPIILGNTYHLHLRPGEDLIAEMGGLHKFMNWDKPILTDSGGFQVFSLRHKNTKKQINNQTKKQCNNVTIQQPAEENGLNTEKTNQAELVEIDEDGVTFTSHIDGSTHRFTPETAIEIQKKLGADIIMAFDECTPDAAPLEYAREAMERTHRWAKRCLEAREKNKKQFLFGIIQGANHKNLREESARYISSLDFDGIAVGGESIGYNMEATDKILDWISPFTPKDKPLYTMGVGLNPTDLLAVVAKGADMFDCVAPTRLARHGMLYTSDSGRLNITNAAFAKDNQPIDKTCACPTCKNYSRAYLHHLFAAQEMTGQRLATIHNIHFMLNLMRRARQAILEDRFEKFIK